MLPAATSFNGTNLFVGWVTLRGSLGQQDMVLEVINNPGKLAKCTKTTKKGIDDGK